MVLILMGALTLAALALWLMKRNRETGLILALCLTLSLQWVGVLA